MIILKMNMDKERRMHVVTSMRNVDINVRLDLIRTSEAIAHNRMLETKAGENIALQRCSYVLGVLQTLYLMGKIDYDANEWGYDYFTKVRVDEYIEKMQEKGEA